MPLLHRRRLIPIAVIAALLTGALTACSDNSAGEAPAFGWQPCAEKAEFDCATLPVPIDWSAPQGDTIDIAVVRDRADDPDRQVGTLVSLPGGPGTSGVDDILKGVRKFSPELQARFDIVSLDPRGVQRSHPVQCDAGLVAARPNLNPDTGGRIEDVRSYARDLADSCRQYTGPLMDHLDAMSVARDVEALRSALGIEQVNLYSRSYGTMPAQAYAELFPQRLRASLLDSVDDHSLDGRGFLASEARTGQDTFTQFAEWCGRSADCALQGTDVHRTYQDLFSIAERGELRDPKAPEKVVRPLELSSRITQRLYGPEWSKLATDLQAFAAQPTGRPETQPLPRRRGEPTAMAPIIFCSDWTFDFADQDKWTRAWRDQSDNAPTLRAHFAWEAGSICSAWPIAAANPPHQPQVTDGPPILILNSKHDPSTPHEWAVGVAATTPRTTLLTYDGWGHGVYDRTSCTTAAADRYFIDLTVPAPGTHCAAA